MKNLLLDSFYNKISKNIQLACKYSEILELSFIIKSCRLKPSKYVFERENFLRKIILYKNWFDEFGNALNISANKRQKIIFNDLSILEQKIVSTDLYHGLPINKIYKISKLCLIFIGEDNGDYCLITFLGLDNYFRTFLYSYGEWQRVSPLLNGFENLKLISKNLDLKTNIEFCNKDNLPNECEKPNSWLSSCPIEEKTLEKIISQCSVLQILKG